MKKKEKPVQKQKEFSVSPFKALKTVAVGIQEKPGVQQKSAAPEPAAKKAVKKLVKSRQELEDDFLFLDAMADVRRIAPQPEAPAQAKAREKAHAVAKSEREEEEMRVFLKAVESLRMDVRFSDEAPEEEAQRPTPVNRLRQLRRGAIRIDLQLDLHGLTRDEALENLERFVRGAYNRGQKGVLVITGKGNNSAGEPVLKSAVSAWLRESGKGMVSEFILAPKEMGGSGAIVVFLKEKKVEPPPEAH